GALLQRQGRARQRLHAEALGVVGSPARRRDLDRARVVERAQRRIEVRVLPHRDQLGRADRVGPGRVRDVHGAADGRKLAVGSRLAPLRITSFTFSWSWPFESSQPLTIWMRSRLAPIGSLSAATRNAGDLPAGASRRSPPIGTPLA